MWKVAPMFSDMESSEALPHATVSEARQALDVLAADNAAFREGLQLPRHYSLLTGTGNAVFVYGIALGNSSWRFGVVAFVVGLAAQLGAASIAIRAFRRRNGAWISGFAGPRATKSVVLAFLIALAPCIIGAAWLAIDDRLLLSALVSACALPATAIADRWWMARYRAG